MGTYYFCSGCSFVLSFYVGPRFGVARREFHGERKNIRTRVVFCCIYF